MIADRKLLQEALNELVRLKSSTEDSTRFLARLYAAALEEWAGRLGTDAFHLDRLVLCDGPVWNSSPH